MRIEKNASLRPFNTFGVEASAETLAVVSSRADLPRLRKLVGADPAKLLMIGGGSNILFTKPFEGVAALMRIGDVEELPAGPRGEARLRVGAGEMWDPLVRRLTASGRPGLENLVLIPGSAGGAAVQNIGAYGLEAAERIEGVEVYDIEAGEFRDISAEECDFTYRNSVFKRRESRALIAVSVTLRLPALADWKPITGYKGLAAEIADADPSPSAVMAAVERLRRRKLPDPAEVGNAGSFFKNPIVSELQARALLEEHPSLVSYSLGGRRVKLAAGWLIEKAGMKGEAVGGAAVWDRQSLVLVNRGGATGADAAALARRVRDAVMEKFGVKLEAEVVIV